VPHRRRLTDIDFRKKHALKLPFANDFPNSVRKVGRQLFSHDTRHRIAASLDRLAHLQYSATPTYRRSRTRLKALKNMHAGETCIVIGNGPSLRGQDLGALGFARTFCLNRGYLMWQEQGLVPDYYLAINELVIGQFHQEISEIPCPLFVPWRQRHLFEGAERCIFIEMRLRERFYTDVSSGLWSGATVTAAALQIAFHMGFSRVVLIGVDHRYAADGQPHVEVVQDCDDKSHFSSEYFGKGVRWNLPDLATSEIAYRMARDAYAAAGREILDATADGALKVFPKVSLQEVASKVRAENAAGK
jgi:hypothetical protein